MSRRSSVWGLVFILAAGLASSSAAQETLAMRRPRFLSMPPGSSRPVDASGEALLRTRMSLSIGKASVEAALQEIARQAKVDLLYSAAVLSVARTVTIQAADITMAAALTEVLLDTGLDVVLLRSGQIGLVKRSRSVLSGRLVGRVTDAKTKEGIRDAEVVLSETEWRAMVDSNGYYRIDNVEPGAYNLVVRRMGYSKYTRNVRVKDDAVDTVNIALDPMAIALNELVTTATGQQRRRDLGNSITTIRADSIMQTAPIRSLTDLLENRVPGLTAQRTSGAPGDPSRLRLRGLSSVYGSNDPLFIVDGVRIYSAQSDRRSGNLTNLDPGVRQSDGQVRRANATDVPAPSPIDQIDPSIIETIEVFKGASAAAMYGTDASNGVIVITTKRGRAGPTQWLGSVSRARTTAPGQWPTGYYRWGHDRFLGNLRLCTLVSSSCEADSLVHFQALNERSLTILGQGDRTALSLSASGGTQGIRFRVSGSYDDEIGVLSMPAFQVERFRTQFSREAPDWMRRPHHYGIWSISSALDANVTSSLDVTLSTSLTHSTQQRTTLERQLGPLAGTYVDTINGEYFRPKADGYAVNTTADLLAGYYTRQTASTHKLSTGLTGTWRPRSWFTATGQMGLEVIPRHDELLLPAGLVAVNDSGAVVRGVGRSVQSNANLRGVVRRPLGRGFVFLTNVGADLRTTSTNDLISSASGLLRGTSSAKGARRVNARENQTEQSIFNWHIEPGITGERIALSTGFRLAGGNSASTSVSQKGGFLGGLLSLPNLNGSWVISEEPWFPFNGLFSSLRLRGVYGQATVPPRLADRLRTYRQIVVQSEPHTVLDNLGNTQLRPERATELEGGIDGDLFDSRLSIELTAYRKTQVDALMSVQLPMSVHGGGAQLINVGTIRNQGVELRMAITPLRSAAMTWTTEGTYSTNSNVLVKIGEGVQENRAQGLVEGYPLNSRWARPILGYSDYNGDNVIDPGEIQVGDSLVYRGLLLPKHIAAFSTSMQMFGGAVGVSAAFSYSGGATQINQTARDNWVLAPELVDPTTPHGQQAAVVASTRVTNPTDYSLMQQISTLRFRSFSVNYRAPKHVANMLGAQQLSIAIQGSNLGLHSNYRGKDPNVSAWSAGESVIDTGQLPEPRTWSLRLDFQY